MPQRRDGTPRGGLRRAGGAGQRDPELAGRISRGEPIYTDDTPEGIVGRRQREDDTVAQPDSYDEGQDLQTLPDVDDYPMLLPGDTIEAKVHHTVMFDGDQSNFTYGITTVVQEGEAEEEAYERVSQIVNGRSLALAVDAAEAVTGLRDDVDAAMREGVQQRQQAQEVQEGTRRRGLRPRSTEGNN